jgi:hypothetical protein
MTERLAPLPCWPGVGPTWRRSGVSPQPPASTVWGYVAAGNGGVNSMPPQHRSIIAMRAFGLRNPYARRMMARILLLIPSTTPLLRWLEEITLPFLADVYV